MGLCYPNTPHYSSSRPWGMKCDRLCEEIFSTCVVFLSIIVNFRVPFSVQKNTWLGDEVSDSPAREGGGGLLYGRGCSSEILNLTPKGDHLGVA